MSRNRLNVVSLLLLAFIITGLAACGTGKVVARDPRRFIREHDLEKLPKFDIPVEMNDRVVAWMEYFQGPGRGHFKRYLERSGRYIPLMQEILKKEGMPRDLVYIALIESGFNTQARSFASAVGPWQFISGTGKRYNLKIDGWVDERRDPYKSTRAAAQYFRDLYGEFGDWYLAMAGYNAGEGRVRQAVSATGSKNFWDLAGDRRALRPETRDYVPKFIAAAIMAKMPERFGFEKIDYRDPFDFDAGTVETQTDIAVIAKCAGVKEEDITDLNPHLVRDATPPYAHNYEIRLPKGSSRIFHEKYAALPKDERIQVVHYEVRRGDTLARIARRFGVNAKAIAQTNGIAASKKRLEVGNVLTIPVGAGAAKYAAMAADDEKAGRKQSKHVVRRGESLGKIARMYGVSAKQLMAWNNLKNPKSIHVGKKLIIRGSKGEEVDSGPVVRRGKAAPQAGSPVALSDSQKTTVAKVGKTHKVKRGETLVAISKKYDVPVKELMVMNNIKSSRNVQQGMNLVIAKPVIKKGTAVASKSKKETVSDEQIAKAVIKLPTDEIVTSGEQISMSTPSAASVIPVAPEPDVQNTPSEPVKLADIDIPKAAPKPPTANANPAKVAAPKSEVIYQVKDGDTLWDIARKHKVSIAELQKWNQLSDPSAVRPGTSLKIHK